jgi:hypothetical protein
MLKHTETAIRAILEADPSITPGQIKAGIAAINETRQEGITDTRPIDTILKPKEVAAILKTSTRNVGRFGRLGYIRRVRVPGASRAIGYSADSVRAFMAGKTAKAR